MAYVEREPVMGVWGGASSEVQGQSPGEGQGAFLKLSPFCSSSYNRGAKS